MPIVPYDESSDPEEENGSEEEQSNGSSQIDSLHLDEEEEEVEEGGSGNGGLCSTSCPLQCCNLSDRLVGRSILLHIDQTPSISSPVLGLGNRSSILSAPPVEESNANNTTNDTNNENSGGTGGGGSEGSLLISASTSLSDTASENMSTRATLGDTPSIPGIDEDNNNGEDSNGNSSSPSSLADSEAERVRRIHNSIFSSLEHDLAELVRIREETIQFLETGVRPSDEEERSAGVISSSARLSLDDVGEGSGHGGEGEPASTTRDTFTPGGPEEGTRPTQPFVLRERLTFQTNPVMMPTMRSRTAPSAMMEDSNVLLDNANTIRIGGRSYSPTGNYENAPPAQPAKPYLEVGLTSCDEKANAARKLLDKLQYGDPEDESACFVRRFWRETSTLEENTGASVPGTSPLSVDIAAIAERTASLEASLEEAFDGLRLRLREMGPDEGRQQNSEGSAQTGRSGGNGEGVGARDSSTNTGNRNESSSSLPYYQAWDEETSIMNNPLNYDIWDELEDGNDAGPIITARINLAERRTDCSRNIRRHNEGPVGTSAGTSVGVGTNSMEGAELDDDSTDDDEVASYFQIRNLTSSHPSPDGGDGRHFLAEMGVSDELGQELMDMFSFSEDEFNLPPQNYNGASNAELEELPPPLFPRRHEDDRDGDEEDNSLGGGENRDGDPESEDKENEDGAGGEALTNHLMDPTSCIQFCPNREDDCSMRVYLDENFLNFPLLAIDETHNEEDGGDEQDN